MIRSLTSALLAITLTLGCVWGQALAGTPPQTSSEKNRQARIDFTKVYIDYVCSIHKIRETFSSDLKEDHSANNVFLAGIRSSTRIGLAADNEIQQLRSIKIAEASMSDFPSILTSLIKRKKTQSEDISKTSEQILKIDSSNPIKANAEIAEIKIRIAKLTVFDEELDKSTFDLSSVAFMILADPSNPNSKNIVDRLIVTKAERKDLSAKITSCFGRSLSQKKQDWMVASATVLNAGLNNKYKSSDDK